MVSVSVALATYNGEAYLAAQLGSIASQTRRPDEIVVGDDQSTDNSIGLLERFADETRIPVHIVRNAHRLGSTRNFGAILTRCRGDMILLSDQDDLWMPNRVERSLTELKAHPDVGFVFSNAALISGQGEPLRGLLWDTYLPPSEQARFREQRGWEALLKVNMVTGATMAFRREAVLDALPIPPGWVHDAWLALLVDCQHGSWPIPEPLIAYRLHPGQQIGVSGRSISQILRQMRKQDAAFYSADAVNFSALAERLVMLGNAEVAERAAYKAQVLKRRAAARESFVDAMKVIPAGLIRGDYSRYGQGSRQALLDVLAAFIAAFDRNWKTAARRA